MKALSAHLLSALAALSLNSAHADWTAFRGSKGDGVASGAALPEKWSAEENLRWKVALPGPGSSSPILVGDKVFVTCWSGYGGELGSDISELKRHLVCINKADGKLLWDKTVPAVQPEDQENSMLMEHGYASSTPVSDGVRVYVFFGKTGALAFDLEGKQLWHTPLGTGSNSRRWGSASSPILHEGKLIVNAYDESDALYAVDAATGKVSWKAEAQGVELAYGSPSILKQGEHTDIMLAVPQEVWGFNPADGKLRWYLAHGLTGNVSPGVVQGAGACYLFGGYPSTRAVAFTPGGKNDLGEKAIRWTSNDSTYIPTPIFHEGHLYVVNDGGFAQCMDAATGKTLYKERVMGNSGGESRRGRGKPFYASPVLADGKLYCQSRRNGVYVLAAKPQYELLSQNTLSGDDSQWNATPAVEGGRLYLRSDRALYCVGQP
jgi:outer membrane protein assembly factor BamB